jgi:hypothetical protein
MQREENLRQSRGSTVPRIRWAILAALGVALFQPVLAAVEKNAVAGEDGIQLSWWPRLPDLPGWSPDPVASMQYGANALVPTGKTFGEADAVLYAKAQYKPHVPDIKSLSDLIERDKREISADGAGARIHVSHPLSSADGRPLSCRVFEPVSSGTWERVCYLEEGDYYLMFALRSRTQASFNASMKAFEALVSRYRE